MKEALRRSRRCSSSTPGTRRRARYIVLIHGGAPAASPRPAVPLRPRPPSSPSPPPAPPAPRPRARPSAQDDSRRRRGTRARPRGDLSSLEPGGGLDLEAVAEKSDSGPLVPRRPAAPARTLPARQRRGGLAQAPRRSCSRSATSRARSSSSRRSSRSIPDHAEAREYLGQNEATLVAMYESKLGPLERRPPARHQAGGGPCG